MFAHSCNALSWLPLVFNTNFLLVSCVFDLDFDDCFLSNAGSHQVVAGAGASAARTGQQIRPWSQSSLQQTTPALHRSILRGIVGQPNLQRSLIKGKCCQTTVEGFVRFWDPCSQQVVTSVHITIDWLEVDMGISFAGHAAVRLMKIFGPRAPAFAFLGLVYSSRCFSVKKFTRNTQGFRKTHRP